MSQFLHGEQGALLVASQLASCAPTFNAKLYAASQTFDGCVMWKYSIGTYKKKLVFIIQSTPP